MSSNNFVFIYLGHVLEEETMSSGASTASDTELVETMATINLMELKGTVTCGLSQQELCHHWAEN